MDIPLFSILTEVCDRKIIKYPKEIILKFIFISLFPTVLHCFALSCINLFMRHGIMEMNYSLIDHARALVWY